MKKTAAFSAAFIFGIAASAAHAAPQQYSFYAQYTNEQNADYTPVTDRLFDNGTVISGTFYFDTSAALVLSNAPATGDLSGYGLYSVYWGSLQQLSAQVGGHVFSADTGSTLVANSKDDTPTARDGVFNIAGNLNGDDVGTGFAGFSTGGFTLTSANIYSIGWQDYLGDQSLPHALTQGPINTGINLIFEDAAQHERTVLFWYATLAPTPVPLPATGWLFGAALAGLLRTHRKNRR